MITNLKIYFHLSCIQRKPMTSWIMKLWLENHDKSEWPDLDIRQPANACHVTDAEMHPSKQNIESMCSEDVFDKHCYRYVDIKREMFLKKTSDEDESPYSDLSVRRDRVLSPSIEEISEFLRPVKTKTNKSNDAERQACKENKTGSPDYTSIDDAKYKKCQNDQQTTYKEDYQDNGDFYFDQDDCTRYYKPAKANYPQDSKHLAECPNVIQEIDELYSSLYDVPVPNTTKAKDNCAMDDEPAPVIQKAKGKNEEHKNKANQMACSKYSKPTTNISKDGTKNENYQQKARKMNRDNCTIDEKPTATFPQERQPQKRLKLSEVKINLNEVVKHAGKSFSFFHIYIYKLITSIQ